MTHSIPGLTLALALVSLTGAAFAQAAADEYLPAPQDLPEAVIMMKPTSVPRSTLLIKDACFYYREADGDIQPFDFASRKRGEPYCLDADDNLRPQDEVIPLPAPPAPASP